MLSDEEKTISYRNKDRHDPLNYLEKSETYRKICTLQFNPKFTNEKVQPSIYKNLKNNPSIALHKLGSARVKSRN